MPELTCLTFKELHNTTQHIFWCLRSTLGYIWGVDSKTGISFALSALLLEIWQSHFMCWCAEMLLYEYITRAEFFWLGNLGQHRYVFSKSLPLVIINQPSFCFNWLLPQCYLSHTVTAAVPKIHSFWLYSLTCWHSLDKSKFVISRSLPSGYFLLRLCFSVNCWAKTSYVNQEEVLFLMIMLGAGGKLDSYKYSGHFK